MAKYLLRNTTKYDINLGDLRYRIPAGQVRDLLGKNARLDIKLLEKSITSGSIAARIKNGALVEVVKVSDFGPPKHIEVSKAPIAFPRTKKSSLILDVTKLDEELNDMILSEEEQLIRELEEEDAILANGGAPVVKKNDEKNAETEKDM